MACAVGEQRSQRQRYRVTVGAAIAQAAAAFTASRRMLGNVAPGGVATSCEVKGRARV